MNTVEEIKTAIQKLPPQEREAVANWLEECRDKKVALQTDDGFKVLRRDDIVIAPGIRSTFN